MSDAWDGKCGPYTMRIINLWKKSLEKYEEFGSNTMQPSCIYSASPSLFVANAQASLASSALETFFFSDQSVHAHRFVRCILSIIAP